MSNLLQFIRSQEMAAYKTSEQVNVPTELRARQTALP